MVLMCTTLPDLSTLDADALKAILLATHEALITTQAQLLSRDHEIEHLDLLIAKLQRMQFGRRSEKIERQIEQLELKLEQLEANRGEQTSPPEKPSSSTSTPPFANKPVRRPLFRARPRRMNPSNSAAPSAAVR